MKGPLMNIAMKPLPSPNLLHELLRYDPVTGHLHYRQPGRGRSRDDINRPAGSITGQGYRHLKIEGTFYSAHRLIWHMMIGPIPDGHFVDHRNGQRDQNWLDVDALDDPARTSLRTATPAQNASNRDLSALRDFRATMRGVPKRGNRFDAKLTHEYAAIHLGSFDTEHDAHQAYREASIIKKGKFANFT
jgi:hypothetical protein